MISCPSGHQLARWIDSALDPTTAAAIEAHVATCGRCTLDIARRRATVPQRLPATTRPDHPPAVRELESAATLAPDPLLPIAATTPVGSPSHAAAPPIAMGTPYAPAPAGDAPHAAAPKHRMRPARRRSVAIACGAALAGVAAALAIAHVVRDEPKQSRVASTDSATLATAAATSTRLPPDLSPFVRDVQVALHRRDIASCKRLVAGLPKDYHPIMRFGIESLVACCDMISGDCAGGTARLARAYAAEGLAIQDNIYANLYCAIEGNLKTRLSRVMAQTSLYTQDHVMDIVRCDELIPHARKVAAEVTTRADKLQAAFAVKQLAGCFAHHRRCDDARSADALAVRLDPKRVPAPELAEKCPRAP